MNTENMINVSAAKLEDLVKAAYDLSRAQGLGFLHEKDGPLDDETVKKITSDSGRIAASMDYVHGRSCKFTVYRDDNGGLWIRNQWYDHTPRHLSALLDRVGVTASVPQ